VKRFLVVLMIISLMVLFSGSIFAQSTSSIDAKLVNQAGKQLENYSSQYYIGFWTEIGGLVLAGLAAYTSPTLTVLGLLGSLVGSVLTFLAAGNIGEAGASLVAATSGQ